MAKSLSIEIVDTQDAVDASAFVLALTTCLEALQAVEMQISKESQAQFVWRIQDASKNSPLKATLVGDATSTHVPFTPETVAETFIEGLSMLASETMDATQMLLGDGALKVITRFSKLAPKGVRINLRGFDRKVSITRETIMNANRVMQLRAFPSARCEDFGTVEGVLSVLSGKGEQTQFSLEESLSGQTIPCYFPKELIPEVQPEWRNRVCVAGMIRRSLHDGEITSIAVEKITRLQASNIDWSKVPALNLTDGVESSAFIRRIRDEE